MATDQKHAADDQEQHQRRHLDQREPEFHLAEPAHRHHVHAADDAQCDSREHPLRHIGKGAPVMHVERHGGDIDDAGMGPVEEEHPACDERRLLAQELARIGNEAA